MKWDIIWNIISIIIGAFVTWYVAKKYYERSSEDVAKLSQDLLDELNTLRKINNTVARYLEIFKDEPDVQIKKDEKGDYIVIRRSLSAKGVSTSSAKAHSDVVKPS